MEKHLTQSPRPAFLALLLGTLVLSLPPASAQSGDPGNCPGNLTLQALGDGSMQLNWTSGDPRESLNVYRGGGQSYTLIATLPPGTTSYHDTTTTAGVPYTYEVRGIGPGGEESHACAFVEKVSIPFFPSQLSLGLAMLGGLGAFALLRRRR